MKISLHKDLASASWHSSIITTYSVDPAFYDDYIQKRLRTYGCENNILIADAAMLKRALNSTPEAFRSAGNQYATVPVRLTGCFHPKLHLRLGNDRARLIVGSANATAAGWGKNQEVIAALDWQSRSGEPAFATMGPLIRKAYDYLNHWLLLDSGESVAYKRRLHLRDSPWLRDLESNEHAVDLPDGSAVDLFCERGGDAPSMLRQLVSLAKGEKVKRLVVISPYWDTNLRSLRELQNALSDCTTFVGLNPTQHAFPINKLKRNDSFRFISIQDSENKQRFLHAKIIVIETNKADHALFGSANCSDNALGRWSSPARNAEVSVYRRLAPGTVLPMLGVDLGKNLRRDEIPTPDPIAPLAEDSQSSVAAGSIELFGKVVTWRPPHGLDAVGAKIRIGGTELSPKPDSRGRWLAELTFAPTFPMIARVIYMDGRISDPIIVHEEMALRRASPGLIDRHLRDAFNRVLAGEEDLIDLILQAHIIFAPEPNQPRPARAGRRDGKRTTHGDKANEYATPEDFRRAVALQPATGDSGRFAVDDPGLQQLLAIVLRGMPSTGGRTPEDDEEEQNRALLAGDSEDSGDITEDDQEIEPKSGEPAPSGIKVRIFTKEQIERRRAKLRKTLDAFDDMLTQLARDPSTISSRLAIQTAFMIRLMLYGCTFDHLGPDGEKARLMVLAPHDDADREYSFALRIARMLKMIWVGFTGDAIVDHIRIDVRYETLPDDLFGLVVMSRWGIARAFIAATASDERLKSRIGSTAAQIYLATARLGPIDPEAEKRIIAQLDSSLGFSEADTETLIRYCRELSLATKATQSGSGSAALARARQPD